MFYLINDAVMQATLFVVAGADSHYGSTDPGGLGPSAWAGAWMIGALIIVALSMIGIPPTGGFFGKWYIILGALERQLPCRRRCDDFHTSDAGLFHQTVGAGLCRRSRVGEHRNEWKCRWRCDFVWAHCPSESSLSDLLAIAL